MALATTLYIQHGKAKAKATEVAAALAAVIGRTIPIGMSPLKYETVWLEACSNLFLFLPEYEWKFVDQAAFKTIPTDTQKSILVNTLGHNLTQCLVGAQDSYGVLTVRNGSVSSSFPNHHFISALAWLLL